MKILNQKSLAIATITLLGMVAAPAAQAADAPTSQSKCREITRYAAVRPKASHPGKNLRVVKFEARRFTVCAVDRAKA